MGNEELISMISVADDIGAVDTCLDIFQEAWTTSKNKLVIATGVTESSPEMHELNGTGTA